MWRFVYIATIKALLVTDQRCPNIAPTLPWRPNMYIVVYRAPFFEPLP